ncbi:MAG: ABC transporter substrate-binding protein [Candidatus Gracilibacteria bacterium]|nr:ABC transporter substrate-binding protein [Candidatus Gracilibacteria bacterium]MDD3119887.1 ABC transporter substrate-binding protein [Candidatus Gracilibacteria bacterium]MDD4529943.1 ABC transporter substrate-binding protein [Candidatus Gracilibacteria bacterium]
MSFGLNQFLTRKNIFFVIIGILLVGVIYLAYSINQPNPNAKSSKEFNVWVVGDDTAGFDDIAKGFKAKYKEYANYNIKFTKFSSYEDYEQTLTSVFGDGWSPDVFVVNNNGGQLLENKISLISTKKISTNDFSKRFNKVFDSLIYDKEEEIKKGKKERVVGIKGIPLGYETMGVFYNWDQIRTVPDTWQDLNKELGNNTTTGDEDSDKSSDSTQEGSFSTIGIGLGADFVASFEDIFSLLAIQNGVDTYQKLDKDGEKILSNYVNNYGIDQNNAFSRLKQEMIKDETNNLDLFAKGKVGMIIGYPSLLKQIELAIKRSGGNNVLNSKNLRTGPIPQNSKDKDQAKNLVNYNYFASSKITKNRDMAENFLQYLSTQEAEKKYLNNFPYYLSAQKELEEYRLKQNISNEYTKVSYESFNTPENSLHNFEKGLKMQFDKFITKKFVNIDTFENDKFSTLIKGLIANIDCNINHLIKNTDFETECN